MKQEEKEMEEILAMHPISSLSTQKHTQNITSSVSINHAAYPTEYSPLHSTPLRSILISASKSPSRNPQN